MDICIKCLGPIAGVGVSKYEGKDTCRCWSPQPIAKRKQVGGTHYQLAIQPIEYILENNLGYCEGNVVKYVSRHASKNGAEDIKKAIQYLEFILKDKYGSIS
jgi:hypothetical protein